MVTISAATLSEAATPALSLTPPTPRTEPRRPVPEAAEPTQIEKATQNASATSKEKVNLEELIQAVDQLENVAKLASRSVHFKINETGDDVQVLVINEDTDEVIREIPPDAVLELAERIQGTLGLLIDKVA